MSPIDLSGKKGVVFGVANQRSIAWSIAGALAGAGAELAFTYLGERLKAGVEKTISGLGDPLLMECDATDDAQVKNVYDQAAARLESLFEQVTFHHPVKLERFQHLLADSVSQEAFAALLRP